MQKVRPQDGGSFCSCPSLSKLDQVCSRQSHNPACMQAPKLRVQAQQLTKRFSSAVQMGVLKNLESLRITHMREENDVQVRV